MRRILLGLQTEDKITRQVKPQLHLSSIGHCAIMHHLPSLKWPLLECTRTEIEVIIDLSVPTSAPPACRTILTIGYITEHFKQARMKGDPSNCWTTVITKANASSTKVPASGDRLVTCSECIPLFCPATVGLNSSTPLIRNKKQMEDMGKRIKCTYNKDLSHIRLRKAKRPTINRIFLFTPWRAAVVNHGGGGNSFYRYSSLSCQQAEEFPSEKPKPSHSLVHFLTLPRDRTPCLFSLNFA